MYHNSLFSHDGISQWTVLRYKESDWPSSSFHTYVLAPPGTDAYILAIYLSLEVEEKGRGLWKAELPSLQWELWERQSLKTSVDMEGSCHIQRTEFQAEGDHVRGTEAGKRKVWMRNYKFNTLKA